MLTPLWNLTTDHTQEYSIPFLECRQIFSRVRATGRRRGSPRFPVKSSDGHLSGHSDPGAFTRSSSSISHGFPCWSETCSIAARGRSYCFWMEGDRFVRGTVAAPRCPSNDIQPETVAYHLRAKGDDWEAQCQRQGTSQSSRFNRNPDQTRSAVVAHGV